MRGSGAQGPAASSRLPWAGKCPSDWPSQPSPSPPFPPAASWPAEPQVSRSTSKSQASSAALAEAASTANSAAQAAIEDACSSGDINGQAQVLAYAAANASAVAMAQSAAEVSRRCDGGCLVLWAQPVRLCSLPWFVGAHHLMPVDAMTTPPPPTLPLPLEEHTRHLPHAAPPSLDPCAGVCDRQRRRLRWRSGHGAVLRPGGGRSHRKRRHRRH